MKKFITWTQVENFVDDILELFPDREFTGVYGLPRGGLVLAVMISHRLNIPMLNHPAEGCLIVDDICDSGESLLHYFKNSSAEKKSSYTIVTMFYKENNLGVFPNYWRYKKQNDWIVFPWEEKVIEGGSINV